MPPLSLILPYVVLGSVVVALLATPLVRRLAMHTKSVDMPTGGRKIHRVPTALWGGLVTGGVIILALYTLLPYATGGELRAGQVWGWIAAIIILLLGGMLDDRFDLPPWIQFLFPVAASIGIVLSGSGIVQVSNPFGSDALSLVWWQQTVGWLTVSLPADLLTILWLLTVTYAMKFLDGLDGLVAGMVVIGGILIASLAASEAYFQPLIATLALIVAGAHIGFLPYNRQGFIFLGEAGSTIAGFSLGVLAIISGAKLAVAGTALAVPLVDIMLVVGGRIVAGKSPFKGDVSHLHFRLLRAGLKPWTAVRVIWAIALVFGLLALTLQTQGKIFLFAGLVVLISLISLWAWKVRK